MSTEAGTIEKEVVAPPAAPVIPTMAPIHAPPAGGGQGGMPVVQVMEIDPASPPDVQAREYAEATERGLTVVMKGQVPASLVPLDGTKPAAAPAVPGAKPEDGAPAAHPLLAFLDKGNAAPELPEPPPAVAEYFKAAGLGEDPRAVLNEARKSKVELENVRTQHAGMQERMDMLGNLSPMAQNILAKDLAGEPWQEEYASKPAFNYENPYSKQNQRKVTDAFSGIKLTDADWEEHESPDGDPRAKRLVESAIELGKAKYEETRKDELGYKERSMAAYQERAQKDTTSRERAVAALNKVPGSAPYTSKVKAMLTDKAIISHFKEDDGVTWKETAALDLWLLADRDAVLGTTTTMIKQASESGAAREQLRRTDERAIPGTKGAGRQEMTAAQLAEFLFKQGMSAR